MPIAAIVNDWMSFIWMLFHIHAQNTMVVNSAHGGEFAYTVSNAITF